jgi:hypothetical protein
VRPEALPDATTKLCVPTVMRKKTKIVTVIWSNLLSSSHRVFCCFMYPVSLCVLYSTLKSVDAELIVQEIPASKICEKNLHLFLFEGLSLLACDALSLGNSGPFDRS